MDHLKKDGGSRGVCVCVAGRGGGGVCGKKGNKTTVKNSASCIISQEREKTIHTNEKKRLYIHDA